LCHFMLVCFVGQLAWEYVLYCAVGYIIIYLFF
jgi:hypothetical protein